MKQLKSQMFIADDTNIQLIHMGSTFTSNLNDFTEQQLLLLKSQLSDNTICKIADKDQELII